ncbi:hypothetical protein B0T14DRAFT_528643 [Immersiella caudata]|uniref:Uncharacterized protein n=1 Tax=Immersiella caudata TaxID=314043 RepID=A0AA40BUV0_9PEZI|nr:hypothetical protein B0T14DRAFT_528643 [Immersiella caudata]
MKPLPCLGRFQESISTLNKPRQRDLGNRRRYPQRTHIPPTQGVAEENNTWGQQYKAQRESGSAASLALGLQRHRSRVHDRGAVVRGAIFPTSGSTKSRPALDFTVSTPPTTYSSLLKATLLKRRNFPLQKNYEVHRFGERGSTQRFYGVSHFRQHLWESHAGTVGLWLQ